MDDNELNPVIPREVLVKQGISAIVNLAGGVFLMIMTIGSRLGFFGLLLSIVALVIGIVSLVSRDRDDRKPGLVFVVAGVMGMVMRFRVPILQPIAGTVLALGAIALFAAGIWKGIRFLLGLKSRR